MNQLGQLWLEMLQYEKLPEAPDAEQILVTGQTSLNHLLKAAAQQLAARGGWKIRVEKQLSETGQRSTEGNFWVITDRKQSQSGCVPEDVNQLSIPTVYGLEPEECMNFPDWGSYFRSFSADEEYICGGEFLCKLCHILAKTGHFVETVTMSQADISLEDGTYMVWKTVRHPESFFYFDNTYEGRLKQLQERQLACLREFDRICKKQGISYFLGGGTLLGAIRHQGLIPWDDDIDVMMLRDQYDRFVSVVQSEIGPDFYYQSNRTDPDYHSIFDKIRMNQTVFKTEFSQRFPGMHQGIFIDIFVHDRTAKHKVGQKLHVFTTLLARSMVFHKWEGTGMHFYGKMRGMCRLMTRYINKTSMEKLERLQYRVVTHFRRKKTGYLYDGTGEHLRHGAFPEEWLGEGRTCVLNGIAYPVPSEAEKYLEYSYGASYMRMPAPQDRKAAHPIVQLAFEEKQDCSPSIYNH